jgi:glycogen phosphorylase
VQDLRSSGYNPRHWYEGNARLREVIDRIAAGDFSSGDRDLFRPLVEHLLQSDDYLLLADYQDYVDAQDRVAAVYRDLGRWTEMAILNVARMGKFSSDRSIRDYCRDVWQTGPVAP